MSDRCAQCGKPAVVRRVLPATDPLGAGGGPMPVCMDCAANLDGATDLGAPGSKPANRVTAASTAGSGAGFLLLAVLGLLFLGALVAFMRANGR